ncbi:glycosyltransferase [Thermus amyloliquefaciens]|uniref:glycosyltransferase n=1 Tax=Thermus amyloliquefaciens TaxID=1449080 RepID=UPI00056F38FA|nr:glycosyltransferase [Thermus amyloliquefaciens]
MKPDVAVLIPVYNNQAGLERTLASIDEKLPLDVVVVDDGSDPPIQLRGLPQPHRGFVLRLDRNMGIEHALNHGLRWILEKDYRYVARLDAGDLCYPGRFFRQREFLEKNPQYALVGGQVRFVDDSGRDLFREKFPTEHEDISRIMHARSCFIHPAVMLRVSALQEVGFYSDRFPAAEDYELFFRLTKRFKVANLPDAVLICHVDPKGISLTKRRRQILSRIKVMLTYFDVGRKESWLGLMKSVALLAVPVPVVQFLKRRLEKWRGWL